jgi:hypothetical protein
LALLLLLPLHLWLQPLVQQPHPQGLPASPLMLALLLLLLLLVMATLPGCHLAAAPVAPAAPAAALPVLHPPALHLLPPVLLLLVLPSPVMLAQGFLLDQPPAQLLLLLRQAAETPASLYTLAPLQSSSSW